MFTATPELIFSARIGLGSGYAALFLLSPANSNESRNEFELVGSVAARLVEKLKAGKTQSGEERPHLPGNAGEPSPDCQQGAQGREPLRHSNF